MRGGQGWEGRGGGGGCGRRGREPIDRQGAVPKT